MRFVEIAGLAAGLLASCTSVKIVQRDGCWIRRTERKLGGVTEEIGPCTRPEPKWVNDRLTRVVQECVAQADYRWQEHALAAWSRGEPLPAQPEQDALVRHCMSQGATSVVAENESLRKRLLEIASDREQLRTGAEQDREQLRVSAQRLADYLGEAAKRPPGNAFASASSTSDGTASSENGSRPRARSDSEAAPPSSVTQPQEGAGAAVPRTAVRAKAPKARPRRDASLPVSRDDHCDPLRPLAPGSDGRTADAACPPREAAPPSAR